MAAGEKRFRVALSFPGEHREFVERVAECLAAKLGRDRVLYDSWYEHEFARIDLDVYLQGLYHNESDLIAVFLCTDYERKHWCKLEWRAIKDLITTADEGSIMPLRFDKTHIAGLFAGDGYVDIHGRQASEIADIILKRLSDRPASATDSGDGSSVQIAPPRLRHGAERLFGREEELKRLDAALADPKSHVFSIVAWGGVGKTSLVVEWMNRLSAGGWKGIERVFDWSFYSQGTREQSAVSADSFVATALEFFGDPAMAKSATSPWDKGARLAQLIAQRRTLLVLDGLEPLQYPPGPLAGKLKDPAIEALLKGLARQNPVLCVVTTRERVADLGPFRDTTAPEWELKHLSTAAGVELLKALGVHGTGGEYEKLVKDVAGHALTLNLIGRFLVQAFRGDIRKRDLVKFEEADAEEQGGHAFRVVEAYEKWFADGDEGAKRQLAVLRLLGLFDRPADSGCLAALRKAPPIPSLTEPIVDLSEAQWNLAVTRLSECGLVSLPEKTPDGLQSIDAHPLIREYFAKQLSEKNPDGWRAAHRRLYEYLTTTTEKFPDTIEGLQPLYQAVAHGCKAGLQEKAFVDIFYTRIDRREAFVPSKLGAIGATVGAVACFFDQPWSRISPSLTEGDQGWLLNEAAIGLRALGRLAEAVELMKAAVSITTVRKKWKNASIAAENLSELELTLGQIADAVAVAEDGVKYADRSHEEAERRCNRVTLADALHQAGRRAEAEARFREAEAMLVKDHPEHPLLYSVSSFKYCDLLLAGPERAAWQVICSGDLRPADQAANHGGTLGSVERRAAQTLEWAATQNWLLDTALDRLTLGRTSLYRAIMEHGSLAASHDRLDHVVDGLRRAGTMHYLPGGLISRAWLRFLEGDNDGARADLDAAWEIAERGPMRLFMADIHLHRARLFKDKDELKKAREMIEKCGYWGAIRT